MVLNKIQTWPREQVEVAALKENFLTSIFEPIMISISFFVLYIPNTGFDSKKTNHKESNLMNLSIHTAS
jgi:hypothetical protein